MAGGASEPQPWSSARPRHTEPVTIPSRYWNCSAPGSPPMQTNISVLLLSGFMLPASMARFDHGTRGRAGKFAELWALLEKQEDEEQMMLPDVCRVDKNESEGEIEIAATTSAVEDDRTTACDKCGKHPRVQAGPPEQPGTCQPGDAQSKRWCSPRWKTVEASQQTVEHVELHALSQKMLFRWGVKLMAAWRKLSLNPAATRERDKTQYTASGGTLRRASTWIARRARATRIS